MNSTPNITDRTSTRDSAAVPRTGTATDRRTVVVTERIEIARSAPEVWTAIADYSFDLVWRAGVTDMTPSPAGAPQDGTRIHEVLRSSGMTFTTDAVVSDVNEGVSYRFAGAGTIGRVSGMRLVEPTGDSNAVFTYQVELRPTRQYRLLRSLLGRTLRSGLRTDLQRLKELLEA
jgi:Polyketide cyclase / dehydrase and lipid transport